MNQCRRCRPGIQGAGSQRQGGCVYLSATYGNTNNINMIIPIRYLLVLTVRPGTFDPDYGPRNWPGGSAAIPGAPSGNPKPLVVRQVPSPNDAVVDAAAVRSDCEFSDHAAATCGRVRTKTCRNMVRRQISVRARQRRSVFHARPLAHQQRRGRPVEQGIRLARASRISVRRLC